jgi:hypothetical protein
MPPNNQQMAGRGSNYTWLLSESAAQSVTFQNLDGTVNETIYRAMEGSIGTSPQGGTGPLYQSFLELWQNLNTTLYPGAGNSNPDLYVPFTWDAVMTFALALNKLIVSNQEINGTTLLSAIKQTSFISLTGLVAYNENGDRLTGYNILNLPLGTQQFQTVGTWSDNGSVTLFVAPMVG